MMRIYRHFLILFALTLGLLVPVGGGASASGRLVADLSQKDFSITTSFHGADLLLFGAVDGRDGDDLIVIITGPPTDIAHRRKDNRAGIWINVETNVWKQAPGFYHILATRPLDLVTTPAMLKTLAIGPENMGLEMVPENPAPDLSRPKPTQLIQALQANMAELNLWPEGTGDIELTQNALFRARVVLPANIVSGTYDIRIMHMRDGNAINQAKTNLFIKKGGLSADIYNLAHQHSALYGIFAIAFAVAAGWLAATAFRRG
jgi:uncharacterized protein (TIGR02186 family)